VVFQLKLVDKKSKEAEFAKRSLFSKHVEMKGKYKNLYISDTSGFQSLSTCCQCHLFSISNLSATNYTDLYIYIYFGWLADWPEDHNFQFFKLQIENIFLIDWFGGPKPLSVDEYLHPKK
jgi:hypothetical protein